MKSSATFLKVFRSSLWLLLFVSNLISATILSVKEWVRPNGTRIVVLADFHVFTKNEQIQRKDLIEHLKSQQNVCLLVEDGREMVRTNKNLKIEIIHKTDFLPNLVSYAQANNIPAFSIEYKRHFPFDDPGSHSKYYYWSNIGKIIYEDFLSLNGKMKDLNISFEVKNDFSELGDRIQNTNNYQEYAESLRAIVNYNFLTKVLDPLLEEKNIYVCAGAAHITFLENMFTKLHYVKQLEVGGYDENDLFGFLRFKITRLKLIYTMILRHKIKKYVLDMAFALQQCGKKVNSITDFM